MVRRISYAQAIREGLAQILERDTSVFVIGQGVWSPWYVGTTMQDLDIEFGRDRIIDSPVSEGAITGAAMGAAIQGLRPIVVHSRMDFMILAMDQIVNQAANWFYMSGGKVSVPLTIRAIINRGGEQAAQHSQSLHAWFMHVPGLKVVMPSTPYDAKGLLVASIRDENPVLYIDDRWLYDEMGEVPEDLYEVRFGEAAVRKEGEDVTVVATSFMVREAMGAAKKMEKRGVSVEVVDLRSVSPLDTETVLASVEKTGRLVTADGGWLTGGMGAEIAAIVFEEGYKTLRAPVSRVSLPDVPAPMSKTLESVYYPTSDDIVLALERVLS